MIMIDDSTGAARGGIPSGGSAGFLAVDSIAPAVTPPRFVPVSVPPASSIGGFARDSSEMSERNAAETLMTRLVCGTAIVLAGTLIGTVTDAAGLSEGAATLGSMAGAAMASVGGGEAMVSGIVVLAEKAGGFLRSAGDAVRSFRDSRGAGIARLNGLAGAAAMLETSAGRMHVLRTDADGWRLVSAEEFARATSRGDVAVASVGRSGVRLSHLTDGRPESRISEDGTVIPAFSDFFVDLDPLLEAALESIVQEAELGRDEASASAALGAFMGERLAAISARGVRVMDSHVLDGRPFRGTSTEFRRAKDEVRRKKEAEAASDKLRMERLAFDYRL